VHGCAAELEELLTAFGYTVAWGKTRGERAVTVTPPPGRKAVLLGDLVDRGPNAPDRLRIAMSMAAAGTGYCIQGNHKRKYSRWLAGRKVTIAHGLQQTIDRYELADRGFKATVRPFVDDLRSHLWLDGGRLAVAHAGLKAEMIGRGPGALDRDQSPPDCPHRHKRYCRRKFRRLASKYSGSRELCSAQLLHADAPLPSVRPRVRGNRRSPPADRGML
jgi:hypothetical protein